MVSPRQLRLMLLRHGEATHNLAEKTRGANQTRNEILMDLAHYDALLTEKGDSQAKEAASYLRPLLDAAKGHVLLASSPLRRALATARHTLPQCTKVAILDCLRELAGAYTCDSRRTATEAIDYALKDLDFKILTSTQFYSEEDTMDYTKPRESRSSLEGRVWDFLLWVAQQATANEELEIVVAVTHCGFIRYLLALFKLFAPRDRKVENAEIRSLTLQLPLLIECLAVAHPAAEQKFIGATPLRHFMPTDSQYAKRLFEDLGGDWTSSRAVKLENVLQSHAIIKDDENIAPGEEDTLFKVNPSALEDLAVKEPFTVILYNGEQSSSAVSELHRRLVSAPKVDDYHKLPPIFVEAMKFDPMMCARLPLRRQNSVTDGSPVAKRIIKAMNDVQLDLGSKELVHGENVLVLVQEGACDNNELAKLRAELLAAHARNVWVLECTSS